MLERTDCFNLLIEPANHVDVPSSDVLRLDHFNCPHAVKLTVASLVHVAHPTTAENLFEFIIANVFERVWRRQERLGRSRSPRVRFFESYRRNHGPLTLRVAGRLLP